MRFLCDHDVDAEVADRLRRLGHDAWTAANAGLYDAPDDDLTVYAHDRHAALLTHDHEFSVRRRRRVIGWHIRLRCPEWDAADVLEKHLDDILVLLARFPDVYIEISKDRLDMSHKWS